MSKFKVGDKVRATRDYEDEDDYVQTGDVRIVEQHDPHGRPIMAEDRFKGRGWALDDFWEFVESAPTQDSKPPDWKNAYLALDKAVRETPGWHALDLVPLHAIRSANRISVEELRNAEPAPTQVPSYRLPGESDEAMCKRLGWGVGVELIGDEGYGPSVIRIESFEEGRVRARCIERRGHPVVESIHNWHLSCREWELYSVTPTQDPNESVAQYIQRSTEENAEIAKLQTLKVEGDGWTQTLFDCIRWVCDPGGYLHVFSKDGPRALYAPNSWLSIRVHK